MEHDLVSLRTGFMKKLIAGAVEKMLRKKLGVDVEIFLDQFRLSFDGEKASVRVEVRADAGKDDIKKLMEGIL